MLQVQFPFWVRIIIWILRTLALAQPPKNGELKDDLEDSQ